MITNCWSTKCYYWFFLFNIYFFSSHYVLGGGMNKKCIISGYSRKRYRKKCIKFCTIFSPPSSPLSLIRLQTTLRLLMTVCLPAVFFPTRSLLLILHTLLTHGSWLIIITIISCCRMLLYKAVPICCLAVNMIYIFYSHIFISLVYMLG